jgi:hypothetical protein
VLREDVPRRRHTRRQALALGAAALAVAGVRPRWAAAATEPDAFVLPLPDDVRAVAAAAGWRTTDVIAAPRRFDLAGVRWARGDLIEVQLRARRRGGEWTRWVGLPPAGDHGPDVGRAVEGTEPAWTGAADELQLRLRGQARGLRVHCVHARPAARRLAARPARQTTAPRIISRTEWGGDTVPPRAAPSYGQVQLAFVHHTVTANDYAPEDSAAIVLAIARYHRDTNRWNDIGYNFLVDQYGQVFEGRAGGVDQAIVGAQAQGWNSVSTGIACLGTFTALAQSEAGLEALAQLIGWKLTLHGVPIVGQVTATSLGGESNRYRSGTPVVFERISGHRDGNVTTCPGDILYAQLADLRNRAARYAVPTTVSSLYMRAQSNTVRGVAPVVVSGGLWFSDNVPPEGAPIDVLYAPPGADYQRIAGAVCAADGSWAASITLLQSGTVYARFPGDDAHPPADSPKTDMTILPRLGLTMAASRIRRGRRVRARGTVAPPTAATSAVLVLERRERGRWRRIGRSTIPVVDGRFGLPLRLIRTGRYRVTVAVPGATAARTVRATKL